MLDRTALHRLVDTLPEEVIDEAYRVLENYKKGPPKGQVDAKQMLEQARERSMRDYEEHARLTGGSLRSGSGFFSPEGYVHSSHRGWEGHTSVTATLHFFHGHELQTTERLSFSDDRKTLIYGVEAKLPDGEAERHEFTFALA